jgi:hypothetical protein
MNPSPQQPVGQLFWTTRVPADGIEVHLRNGFASLEAFNVPINDFGTGANSLFGTTPPIPGTVSFKVVWSGDGELVNIENEDPVYGGFAGRFVHNSAQMEWTGTVGDLTFASAPLSTSSSSFAEIGHERNGSFFQSDSQR